MLNTAPAAPPLSVTVLPATTTVHWPCSRLSPPPVVQMAATLPASGGSGSTTTAPPAPSSMPLDSPLWVCPFR